MGGAGPQRWSLLAVLAAVPLAVVGVLSGPKAVTMRELEVRGHFVDSVPEVSAVLQARIATPFGRIPVSAHVRLIHDCGRTFRGSVGYHPLVKLMARLRGLRFVQSMDGEVVASTGECLTPRLSEFVGQATVDSLVLKGWLRFALDSLAFEGPAWLDDSGTYHADLRGTGGERTYEVRLLLHHRALEAPLQ